VTEVLNRGNTCASTRREFGKTLALAAAAPLLTAGPAEAEEPAKPPQTEGPTGVVQALTEVVRLRHGKHLNAEQLTAIGRNLTASLAAAERLRHVSLKNSDEPAFAFTADVR
jgi:hypothetical protein